MTLQQLIISESRKETSNRNLTQLRRELCDIVDRGFQSAPEDVKTSALVDGLAYLEAATPRDLDGKSIGKILSEANLPAIASLKSHR